MGNLIVEEIKCKHCSNMHLNDATGLCNGCWELKHRIEANPTLAAAFLKEIEEENDR